MLRILLGIACSLLWLYDVVVLAWVVIELAKPRANTWTELIRALVEPVLRPIRGFLNAKLPSKWQILDWSPLALWVISGLIQRLFSILRG